MTQHEELDVFGGRRSAHQQDQPEHLAKDQVQQPQRHAAIMPNQRSPLVSDPGPTSGTPQVGPVADEEGRIEDLEQERGDGQVKILRGESPP